MTFHRHLIRVALWLILLWAAPLRPLATAAVPGSASRSGTAGGTEAARPWPVDIPIHLSSSFGEFREGHLHAGVDIRSFGREGIPCRSVGRGYVSRLRASPFGYGKAVYVGLETGETVVYAHLSEFAPEIDSVVCAAQQKYQRYEVDLRPVPGDLPVEEGQVIAYTGRTGAAAPHLHFEVRDSAGRPVNPLELGWPLRDGAPPSIRRLECLPLAPDARVNGRFAPAVAELRAAGPGAYAVAETLHVSGAVGFGAQVVDRTGDSSGNLAPYRVELEVDGRTVSRIEMRRFAYDQTAEVELAYDVARARTRGQHYLLLFHRQGETLGHREFVDGGVVRTSTLPAAAGSVGGVHYAVVRATDYAGNVTTASWAFVVSAGEGGGFCDTRSGPRPASHFDPDGGAPGVLLLRGHDERAGAPPWRFGLLYPRRGVRGDGGR